MAEKQEKKLIQTKNFFVIRAMVTGKDNPAKGNGFKTGKIEKGKFEGRNYKSIRFIAKTSNDNIVPVELFGSEEDNVYFYSKSEKKTLKALWSQKGLKPKTGFELITPKFDQVQSINDTYKDGDLVVITGKIEYSQYEDKDKNVKLQKKFIIKDIKPSQKTEMDFDDEKFEEYNEFNQEVVIIDTETDEGKLYLNAYHINYNETFIPVRFEINTEDSGFVSKIKSLKFGDFVKVFGIINNRSVETSEETPSEDFWGKKPTIVKSLNKSLEITAADGTTHVKKKYKEKDFVIEVKEMKLEEKINTDDVELPFEID